MSWLEVYKKQLPKFEKGGGVCQFFLSLFPPSPRIYAENLFKLTFGLWYKIMTEACDQIYIGTAENDRKIYKRHTGFSWRFVEEAA